MERQTLRGQVPDGVKDRLPREAGRVRALAATLDGVYRRWGYREAMTPAFEFLDTVAPGIGSRVQEELYQFFDRRGRTLALRPDMTTPIARLVATKLAAEPLPLRLTAFGAVFRHRDRLSGYLDEVWQSDVELIGAAGDIADAEVIALACAAIAATGVEGFKVGIGHVDVVQGLFAEAAVDPALAAQLEGALVTRDLVAYEKAVTQANLDAGAEALLLALVTFHGSWQEALARFSAVKNGRVRAALTHLGSLLRLLEAHGVAGQVTLDLGLVRSFGYYTGVVFEAFAPGVGAPVCGGGRYDRLLSQFSVDLPATGFALDIDRLLTALERQGRSGDGDGDLDVLIVYRAGQEALALRRARALRQQGLTVEVELQAGRRDDYVRARRPRRVIAPDTALEDAPPAAPRRTGRVGGIH